jgi:hypothetical protein
MPQVYNFGAFTLQYAAHDIDSRIMPVKKRSGGDYTDFVSGCKAHNIY